MMDATAAQFEKYKYKKNTLKAGKNLQKLRNKDASYHPSSVKWFKHNYTVEDLGEEAFNLWSEKFTQMQKCQIVDSDEEGHEETKQPEPEPEPKPITKQYRQRIADAILADEITTGAQVVEELRKINPNASEETLRKAMANGGKDDSIRGMLYVKDNGRAGSYLLQKQKVHECVWETFNGLEGYEQKRYFSLCNGKKATLDQQRLAKIDSGLLFKWWVFGLDLQTADPALSESLISQTQKSRDKKSYDPILLNASDVHVYMLSKAESAVETKNKALALSCVDYALCFRANADVAPDASRSDKHENFRQDYENISGTWLYKIKYPAKTNIPEYNKISLFDPIVVERLLDIVFDSELPAGGHEIIIDGKTLTNRQLRPLGVSMIPFVHECMSCVLQIQKNQLGHKKETATAVYLGQFIVKGDDTKLPKNRVLKLSNDGILDEGAVSPPSLPQAEPSREINNDEIEMQRLIVQQAEINLKIQQLKLARMLK